LEIDFETCPTKVAPALIDIDKKKDGVKVFFVFALRRRSTYLFGEGERRKGKE